MDAPKAKRLRNRKWTVGELSELVAGYAQSYALLSSQATDTVTLDGKNKAYAAICDAVNAVGGAERDVAQIKVKWSNESCRVKRLLATKWRAMERNLVPTEEQEERLFSDLTPLERRIATILPADSYKGMQAAFEGHSYSSATPHPEIMSYYIDAIDPNSELEQHSAFAEALSPMSKPLEHDDFLEQSKPALSLQEELLVVEKERLVVEKDIVSELRVGNSLRHRLVEQNEQIIKLLLTMNSRGQPTMPIVIPSHHIKAEDCPSEEIV